MIAPLTSAAEKHGVGDFTPMWASQAAALGKERGAAEVTRGIVSDAFALLGVLAERARAAGALR
jgi:nitronate monooxygenase